MNRRVAFAAPVAVCAALLGYGYFLQYAQGLEPCPLCMVQRFFFYLVAFICLVGAIHKPGRVGSIVYGSLTALFAIGGAATAGRQVWLQHLPADKVPQCGPDLMYMLENLPLSRTLEKLFYGSGECAKVDWTFLGLSIAEWSLAWFIALVLYAVWLGARAPRLR